MAVMVAGAAHADLDVAPIVPHSETLARRQLPTGDPPSVERGDRYACGGIGERSRTMMRSIAPRYDLALTFATRSGHFLADVAVQVLDRRGDAVLVTTCDAPILLVKVPAPGRYTVVARNAGREVRHVVRIPPRGSAAAVLRWPDER